MKKPLKLISLVLVAILASCGGTNQNDHASTEEVADTISQNENANVPEEKLEFTVEALLKDLSAADVKEKYDGKWLTLEGEVYQVSDEANYNDSATVAFSFVADKDLLNSAKITPKTGKDAYLYSFGCDTYLSPTYFANNKDFKLKEGDYIKIKGRFENHFSSGPQFDKAIVIEHKRK